MEFLKSYVVSLCAVALLSACAQMLLPKSNGGLKDSVRCALGIIFVAVLLRPVAMLLPGG